MNRRWCKLAPVVRGAKAWNFRFGSQEVEGEGYMRLKLDLEVWEASFSAPLGRVALLLCNFCRPMLCISAAYAVMRCLYVYVCLSVCPSRSWIVSKWINVSLKIFHHRVYSTRHSSSSIPNVMAIFRRNPPPLPNGGVECRWGRHAEITILNQYLASVRAVKRSSGRCSTLSCDEPRRVYNTSRWWAAEFVDGGKQRRVYDKKPQRYAEDNVTQWLIWNLSNNNERLRTSYFVEANYWRTQSIARPLCNSRATCFIPNNMSCYFTILLFFDSLICLIWMWTRNVLLHPIARRLYAMSMSFCLSVCLFVRLSVPACEIYGCGVHTSFVNDVQ